MSKLGEKVFNINSHVAPMIVSSYPHTRISLQYVYFECLCLKVTAGWLIS
uniref:Uncharacterized protein n=1 Tax=Anguilla anguilla TaxID=7936 RepID=A0A0E9U6H6_ANGAN